MPTEKPGHTINDLDQLPADKFAECFSSVKIDETGYVQSFTPEQLKAAEINQNEGAQRFAGVSDQRITNNVMRHQYRQLSENEKINMQAVKDVGVQFHDMLTGIGESRELSLAKTKIEEAVMWATKAITG
jgi:hypothetical protein